MNRLRGLLKAENLDALLVSAPSNIKYATGYLADYCYVLVTKDRQYYFTDGRFTIEATRDLSDDWTVVEITTNTAQVMISSQLTERGLRVGYDSDIMHSDYLFVQRVLEHYESVDITDSITKLRETKNETEIECIISAQRIAEKSLEELKPYMTQGVSERELCAKLDYLMRVNGADNISFDTIVAFGENSAIAHAKPSDRQLKVGDIILIDFGCKVNGYCSDMTRCFVFGEASDKVKDMYDAVLDANKLSIDKARAGMTGAELDKVARDYLNSRGYEGVFTHSLGHGVGIDIHESPNLSPRAVGKVLEENAVVTIEPGVYIEGLGGIRIEDMIVIKEDGCVNLTTSNKKLEIINN